MRSLASAAELSSLPGQATLKTMIFELTSAELSLLEEKEVHAIQNLFYSKYGEEYGNLLLDIFTGHEPCKILLSTD